jgi:adenylate cyclase
MAMIRVQPSGRAVEVSDGSTILKAAMDSGEPFAHACGGNGRCSTCRVLITEGLEHCDPRSEKERSIEEALGFPPDIRLACQTSVHGNVSARRLVLDDHDIELTSLVIQNASPERIGVEKHVAILFADIRGFTSFSESLLPYDVIHVLNRYFRLMDDVVREFGGRIDNIMGDGFLALFEGSDPRSTARAATTAGIEMLNVVDREMRPYLEDLFSTGFA